MSQKVVLPDGHTPDGELVAESGTEPSVQRPPCAAARRAWPVAALLQRRAAPTSTAGAPAPGRRAFPPAGSGPGRALAPGLGDRPGPALPGPLGRGWQPAALTSPLRSIRRLPGASRWSSTGRRRRWDPGSPDPLLSLGMKVIALVVFISCLTVPTLSSFWQFQRMVKHVTGRSALLSYYGYGCYCGLGGKGVPVDDTDRCCLTHDCCYKKLKESGCQPVLNSYQFHIINKTVVCGCSLGPGGSCLCGLRACECDKQSSYCFRRSLPTYERNFKQLSSRPQCGRHKLQC